MSLLTFSLCSFWLLAAKTFLYFFHSKYFLNPMKAFIWIILTRMSILFFPARIPRSSLLMFKSEASLVLCYKAVVKLLISFCLTSRAAVHLVFSLLIMSSCSLSTEFLVRMNSFIVSDLKFRMRESSRCWKD